MGMAGNHGMCLFHEAWQMPLTLKARVSCNAGGMPCYHRYLHENHSCGGKTGFLPPKDQLGGMHTSIIFRSTKLGEKAKHQEWLKVGKWANWVRLEMSLAILHSDDCCSRFLMFFVLFWSIAHSVRRQCNYFLLRSMPTTLCFFWNVHIMSVLESKWLLARFFFIF